MRRLTALCILLFLAVTVTAAEKKPIKPAKGDKCPVCGMFVAKYPDWVGEIIFNDGSVAFFDGAKDLFKYYFNLDKYNPKKSMADIEAIYVTEYYNMKLIDASTALYVIGSDVYGPMGRELIPFETREDAEIFIKDHKGERILKFREISVKKVMRLD
jgi:nitrous oxide reductase accessory protein NosL